MAKKFFKLMRMPDCNTFYSVDVVRLSRLIELPEHSDTAQFIFIKSLRFKKTGEYRIPQKEDFHIARSDQSAECGQVASAGYDWHELKGNEREIVTLSHRKVGKKRVTIVFLNTTENKNA